MHVSAVACRGFFLCSTLLPFWNLIFMKPGVVWGLALLMPSDGIINFTRMVACMYSCPNMNTSLIEKAKYMYHHQKS